MSTDPVIVHPSDVPTSLLCLAYLKGALYLAESAETEAPTALLSDDGQYLSILGPRGMELHLSVAEWDRLTANVANKRRFLAFHEMMQHIHRRMERFEQTERRRRTRGTHLGLADRLRST